MNNSTDNPKLFNRKETTMTDIMKLKKHLERKQATIADIRKLEKRLKALDGRLNNFRDVMDNYGNTSIAHADHINQIKQRLDKLEEAEQMQEHLNSTHIHYTSSPGDENKESDNGQGPWHIERLADEYRVKRQRYPSVVIYSVANSDPDKETARRAARLICDYLNRKEKNDE